MTLNDMIKTAQSPENTGKYLFHGSNVLLEPGRDNLIPFRQPYNGIAPAPVMATDIANALRYALVRKFASEQFRAQTFACFITQKYRLIVEEPLANLENRPIDDKTYIYMLDAHCFDEHGKSVLPVPVLARADITKTDLISNDFKIDTLEPWFDLTNAYLLTLDNTDEIIETQVLPKLFGWNLEQMGHKINKIDKSIREHKNEVPTPAQTTQKVSVFQRWFGFRTR